MTREMAEQTETAVNKAGEKRWKRALVIINPVSGDGRALNLLPELIKGLTERGFLCMAVTTTGKGMATELVLENGAENELVICAGGDGTANEVIRGLMQLPEEIRPSFGYIPSGSTNDFANTLGLPKRGREAVRTVLDGCEVPIDVGLFNDRYYAYVCAFGAFTDIAYSTSQTAKNLFGQLAYIAKGLGTMKNINPIRARFHINGETIEDDFVLCCISNSRIIGGIIRLSDRLVEINDGKFEIILIKYPPDALALTKIVNAITNGEMSCEYIRMYRSNEVDVEILEETQIDWSLDGECERDIKRAHIVNIHSGIRAVLGSEKPAGTRRGAAAKRTEQVIKSTVGE